jgi:hypothetical protein
VNTVRLLNVCVSFVPGLAALALFVVPVPGYQKTIDLVSTVSLALLVASFLIRSDGLFLVSLSTVALALGLVSTTGGVLVSFAVVVLLLASFDFVELTRSLFGITDPAADMLDAATVSRYLEMLRGQAVRSSGLGLATFFVALAVVGAPFPELVYANPVSGSGILALCAMLLIALATSKRGWLRGTSGRPLREPEAKRADR